MTENPITATTTVREVMVRYPHTEAIFNKHGLTGCGGPRGPLEPVGFFATVHRVDPETLIRELNEATRNVPPAPTATQSAEVVEADIYRAFVKTALGIVVTVGCLLGAINLAAMALAGVTGSYWEAVTQAHGHAQIFGWVGLFIMGVAYHVMPRLKATQLHSRSLAMASFWLMLTGIILRMIAQPLAESPSFASIVVLSAIAELVAASFFVYVVGKTLASNPSSADFWDKYVIASASWFWVATAGTVAISLHTANAGIAVIPPALDVPYLHVALMGFASLMIFGITLRTIPVFMGLRQPNVRAFNTIFWGLNLGILLKTGSGWLDATAGTALSATLSPVAAVLELVSVLAFVYFLGIFGKRERNIREEGVSRNYEKFIVAAYAWLVVAATASAAYALYTALTGQAVPHSLVGAYRHSLTVGFISMMILGMAARVIPVFTGVRLHNDFLLLVSFVLLNLGNVIRVLTQPLADMVGGLFFVPMGVSGFIEVSALGIFVYNLWRTIDGPVDEGLPVSTAPADGIKQDMIVADVLNLLPEALDIFLRYGFTPLQSAVGRSTIAKSITVEQACQMKSVDLQALLKDLNEAYRSSADRTAPASAAPAEQPAAARNGTTQEPAPSGNGKTPDVQAATAAAPAKGVSRELVMMALKGCYDPEIPVNIVDLGLVYELRIEGSTVALKMTLTAPGCPMGNQMVTEIKDTVGQLPGVEEVTVDLVFDPPWTPDRMTDEAKRQLGMPTA